VEMKNVLSDTIWRI